MDDGATPTNSQRRSKRRVTYRSDEMVPAGYDGDDDAGLEDDDNFELAVEEMEPPEEDARGNE